MRLITLIFIVCALAIACLGQPRGDVIQTYEKNVIARPFFVRWVKDLTGPGFGQLEKLQLKSDGTFHYSYLDRYCGTFNNEVNGTWTNVDNRLSLQPNDHCCLPWTDLIIEKRRLYISVEALEKKAWAMKRKLL